MTRSRQFPLAATVAAIATIVLVAGGISLWRSRPEAETGSAVAGSEGISFEAGEPAALYFPSTSGMLEIEMRTPPGGLEAADRKRWLTEQLLDGPQSPELRAVFPPETEVASVFAAPDGTVFVDLAVPETGAGMGSTDELLTLYSVVNTLLLDDASAQRMVLLINGRQRESLAGHLDTSRPLYPRPDLVRNPA